VFAKVKGYPPWPARVTSRKSTLYKIFFYGTHERAGLKRESIWPYTKENLEKFGPNNKHRQFYSEGLIEIEDTPEIAPFEDLGTLDDTSPMDISQNSSKKTPIASRTPVSLSKTQTSTPLRRTKAVPITTPETSTPTRGRGRKRKANDSLDDDQSKKSSIESSPNESLRNRRGRPSISKKDDNLLGPNEASSVGTFNKRKTPKKVAVVAPYEMTTPTKVWIKVKSTGELIEINLDEEPKFESEKLKLECDDLLATKVKDFKRRIQDGELEELKSLQSKRKNQLSKFEKDLLDILGLGEKAELEKRKKLEEKQNMIQLLQTEKKIVDLDVILKKTLLSESPDLSACKAALDELNSFPMTRLMIKKLAPFVNTILCLKNYPGPKSEEKTVGENTDKGVKEVQQTAEKVWRRILALFQFKGDSDRSFWDAFVKLSEEFKQKTKGMEEKDFLCLVIDPTADSFSS